MIVSMPRWPYVKKFFAPLLRTSTFSSFPFFFLSPFSSALPCSPTRLLQGVLFPMYIPTGINFYSRHGARGVSSMSSSSGSLVSGQSPLPTSSKSLIGVCGVVGAFLLGPYQHRLSDPTDAESVSQPSSFGRSVLSTSVERLMLSA